MKLEIRVDLAVPFVEKEDAKALGARWDTQKKRWYAPPGTELGDFDRWLPSEIKLHSAPDPDSEADSEEGVALSDLLARVKGVLDRGMPEAVWVRAEVSEISGKNGHIYLQLAERNDRGDPLARAKGILWKSRASVVTAKFAEATGEGLKSDIKILCLARVRFDPLFGLDLIIEDVDPSYTLGDLAAKLARIRAHLVAERLYERNQGLPAPLDFVRVAVISPETSAGLGDFRRETDRLQNAGLCEFLFYPATFQGLDAPASIRAALNEAVAAHRRRPFDALVLIRGGGSVTDLAWLNDLELASLVCRSPIPVLTGIGHERDSTILDEVAHKRFDTPSKVALHITTALREHALAAIAALDRIKLQVARILTRERTALATQADRVHVGAGTIWQQAEDESESFTTLIRTATHFQLREAGLSLEAGHARLVDRAEQTLSEAELELKQSMETIDQWSQVQLGLKRAAIENTAHALALQASARIDAASQGLDYARDQTARASARWVVGALGQVEDSFIAIASQAAATAEAAKREVETYLRITIGLGPQATLKRGFAIARDADDRPVTSRRAALRTPEFTVQFHDGSVPVANRDFDGGSV